MTPDPETPPRSSSDGEAAPEKSGRRPAVYFSILGLFILASLAVLLLSWPGLQIARHTRAAEDALEGRDWKAARPHLEAITARFPDAWLRQRQLGDCLLELERPEDALAAYQASLEHHPDQELRARIGRALYLMNPEDPEARRLLEEARSADPADPRTNFYVANLREEQERYREAAYYYLGATADPYWFKRSRPHIEGIRKRLLGNRG